MTCQESQKQSTDQTTMLVALEASMCPVHLVRLNQILLAMYGPATHSRSGQHFVSKPEMHLGSAAMCPAIQNPQLGCIMLACQTISS